jgi:hypothetical protein
MVCGNFISKTLVASLLFWTAGPFAASAATVSSQGGEVLISKGQGFVPLKSLTEVAPGDR